MDYDTTNDEISLQELWQILKRGFWLAAGSALLFATLAYLYTSRLPDSYQVNTKLMLSLPSTQRDQYGDITMVTANAIDPSAFVAAVKSRPILLEALASLPEDTREHHEMVSASGEVVDPEMLAAQRLGGRISVQTEVERLSSIITINVTGTDPERITQEANAVANALMSWDRARATDSLRQMISSLEQQIEGIDEQLSTLGVTADSAPRPTSTRFFEDTFSQAQLAQSVADEQIRSLSTLKNQRRNDLNIARTLEESAVGLLDLIEPAYVPLAPSGPNRLLNTLIGFILGGFLGYVAHFIRQIFVTRLRNIDEIISFSKLPLLGDFPKLAVGNRQLPHEKVRYLRANVMLATRGTHPKIILVTSAVGGEGKSSVSLSLSESFARSNQKTLLIDADLRQPVLYKDFYVAAEGEGKDLATHLRAQGSMFDPMPIEVGSGQQIDFIPGFSNAEDAPELLSQGIRACLQQWQAHYDVIVIDSAPILPVADTLIIAPHVSSIVMVVSALEADKTRLQASLETFQRIGVKVTGVVVTQVSKRQQEQLGYGYGYGYGYGENSAPKRSRQPSNT